MSKRKEFEACILLYYTVSGPVDPSGPAHCDLKSKINVYKISLIGVGILLCEVPCCYLIKIQSLYVSRISSKWGYVLTYINIIGL
jgi:hypothetical protein